MRVKIVLSILVCSILNLVLFQNCGGSGLEAIGKSDEKQTDNTGQPYDGKIFVSAGAICPDGTFVQARVVTKSLTQATVVRENCKDVTKTLGSGEFTIDPKNPDGIRYNNQTLVKETPWTPIPLLSTWYHQLTGPLNMNSALVYDIDLFETSTAQITSLKQAGHVVICNFSSGTYEDWRPDAASFPANTLGNNVGGSPGEKWADIRSSAVRDLMVARMNLAQSKGCDGVDLDSADGYANNSGFPISISAQIDYNQALAFAAHDRHLIVALKNTADLVTALSESYDFAIAEQCFEFNECAKYLPFTTKGKAVLSAEYTAYSASQCNSANSYGISLSFLSSNLDGSSYRSCP